MIKYRIVTLYDAYLYFEVLLFLKELEWTLLVNSIGSEARLNRPLRDPVHVFGLANILKRPIVVVCGRNSSVSGIYLPLLFDPDACNGHPLLLAHNEGAFLPLVEMESEIDSVRRTRYFPLVDCNLESLSVRFLTEDEKSDSVSVVMRYINIREFFVETGQASSRGIPFAALSNNEEKSISSHSPAVPMATAAFKVQTEMSEDRQTAGAATEAFHTRRGDSNSSTAHLHPEERRKYGDDDNEEATGITSGGRLCAERTCKLNGTQRCFRSQAEDSASSGHSTLRSQLTKHHQHLSASPSINAGIRAVDAVCLSGYNMPNDANIRFNS